MERPLSTAESYVLGGMAACVAVTVSNIPEVAKTRLQLQGELVKRGGVKVYSNVFDVFVKTWKGEGVRGIQRGLGIAYVFQTVLNGARLGFYEPLRQTFNQVLGFETTEAVLLTSLMSGAASGTIGTICGNPLFLVKARMQAYSPALPVGTQRYYKNGYEALVSILRAEGWRGFGRGLDAAIFRAIVGSSGQLPTYYWTKNQLVSNGILPEKSIWTYLASSSVSGLVVLAMMQPPDTVLTRIYNQPTKVLPNGRTVGVLYKNPIDCLWKTFKIEGPFGWYKGTTAHFLRIVPHTILTLTANDVLVSAYRKIRETDSD